MMVVLHCSLAVLSESSTVHAVVIAVHVSITVPIHGVPIHGVIHGVIHVTVSIIHVSIIHVHVHHSILL